MGKTAAVSMALIAVAMLLESCGGAKENFGHGYLIDARPGVDCINRPNN